LGKFIENETIGACIGGDEFILIVPLANRGKIADIAAGISGELAKYEDPAIPAEKRLSMAIGYGTAYSVKEDFFKAYEDAEKMMRYVKLLDKNSDSRSIMKTHPEIGYRIAMSWSNFEELAPYIPLAP